MNLRFLGLAALFFATQAGAAGINVTLSATSDGAPTPTISGRTNLPEGTKLLVTLRRKQSDYEAQSNAEVKAGAFRAGPFTDRYAPLASGRYQLEVVMPIAAVQPASVQAVVGEDSKNLSGQLVRRTQFGRMVILKTDVQVGMGKTSKEADDARRDQSAAQKKAWIEESCQQACDMQARASGLSFDVGACKQACRVQR